MFNFKPQPQPQQQPPLDESTRMAQFQALVEIIRTEIRVGVDPLRNDVQNLKLSVDDVRRAQDRVYTREVIDLKFKDRDDQTKELRRDHEELVKAHAELVTRTGGQVKQFFTTAGVVLSPVAIFLAIAAQFHWF